MRILLIEDDAATSQTIELMLRSEGMNVNTTDDADDGVDCAKVYDYDLVLTDTNICGVSGLEVVRRIRAASIKTPIIVLSGALGNLVADCVAYLARGADDFMAKPIQKDELVARIIAVVRRCKGIPVAVIEVAGLRLDLHTKLVEFEDHRVHLTGKEYGMLELLMMRQGATLTKEMFLNHLYGGRDEPELKIIDVFMCKLRKKLSAVSEGRNYIETVWGRGYRICDPGKVTLPPGKHWQKLRGHTAPGHSHV